MSDSDKSKEEVLEKPKDEVKERKEVKQIAQKLRIPILILNIIGTLCVLSQCISSILRSSKNLELDKLQFIDVQVLIVSFLLGLAEIFVLLIVVLQGKLKAKLMNWFTLTKSMHSYFVVQIIFSFIQGPQDLFPRKTVGGQPNQFYNIYNTVISCFMIIGWIFNSASYLLYLIGQINKKKQEKKAKKEGGQLIISSLY